LVWSGHISALAYDRHARKLQTSDRELVSYSGGWALTQKMVNVATRQVALSDSLHGEAPATEPTTMGAGVDSNKVLADMTDDLVKQVVASVLQGTFPISVVARDGLTVVLSQGGQAVHQGATYDVVALGKELKDPQTGQSLGRVDAPCCVVVVDRVTPNLSYGHLEGVKSSLDALPDGALQVRAELKGGAAVAATSQGAVNSAEQPGAEPTVATAPAAPTTRLAKRAAIAQAPASSTNAEDHKW
jgi:hypothetical protein